MLVAFIGSHGTGKTTTSLAVRKQLGKHWFYYKDVYRSQAELLGYQRPRDILLEDPANKSTTVSAMTGAALGSLFEWCQQPNLKNGLIDLGPTSILAYHRYWMQRCEMPSSPFLFKLCQRISTFISLYIYLPVDVVPLVKDNMRNDDPEFQRDIDQWVKRNIIDLKVSSDKIYVTKEETVEARVREVIERIEGLSTEAE